MISETLIRIVPEKAEITVEQRRSNVVCRKQVTPEALARCFLQSKFDDEVHHSGLLPEGCITMLDSVKESTYFLHYTAPRADITYCGTEYIDFPLPRMIFSLRYLKEERKVAGCRLCVIPPSRISMDMPTYYYPFSNVGDTNGLICLGNNALPVYPDPARLSTLPGFILRLPNNNDHYNREHNKLQMEYRDLLEHLKDKEPEYYYSDILIPNNKTLNNFIVGR